jgi:hypothetical protein
VKPPFVALSLAVVLGGALVSAPAQADPSCIAAYEQTQTLRKDGKPAAAKAQAASCAHAECPAILAKDCTKWLAELEAVVPTVILEARGSEPSAPVRADVRVKVDGVVLTEKVDGKPLAVEPGSRLFTFEVEGAAPVARTVVVKEGEKNKKVSVTLAPAARAEGRPIPLGFWLFGGASVVALATSAVFAIDGFAKKGDLEECKPRCAGGDVDAMSSSFTVADVALGAGLVAGVAAAYLFVTRPEGRREPGETQPSPAVRTQALRAAPFAVPVPGGGAMGITARF